LSSSEQRSYCAACDRTFSSGELVCPHDGGALLPLPSRPTLAGTTIDGRYRLVEPLGSGGMGSVYQAIQLSVERPVALKVINPALASDARIARRFLREARIASGLSHSSLVTVLDFGATEDGVLYMVMELIRGRTLGERVAREGPMDPDEVRQLAISVAEGLATIHGAGVLHRDLKPDNLMLVEAPGQEPAVKLLDFGVAKDVARHEDLTHLTETGSLLGTPKYMSPEVARGDAVDERSDLYSLGCVLYFLVAGRAPFDSDGPVNVAYLARCHALEPPPPLPLSVPDPLRSIIERLLRKAPDERFESAAELVAALRSDSVPSVPGRPASRLPWLVGAAALALVGVGAALALSPGSRIEPSSAPATTSSTVPDAAAHEGRASMQVTPADAAPAAPVDAAADAAMVRLRFTSEPRAMVSIDGKSVGRTPLAHAVARSEQALVVEVSRAGYVTRQLTIEPQRDRDVEVVLKRATRRGSRADRGGKDDGSRPKPKFFPGQAQSK